MACCIDLDILAHEGRLTATRGGRTGSDGGEFLSNACHHFGVKKGGVAFEYDVQLDARLIRLVEERQNIGREKDVNWFILFNERVGSLFVEGGDEAIKCFTADRKLFSNGGTHTEDGFMYDGSPSLIKLGWKVYNTSHWNQGRVEELSCNFGEKGMSGMVEGDSEESFGVR